MGRVSWEYTKYLKKHPAETLRDYSITSEPPKIQPIKNKWFYGMAGISFIIVIYLTIFALYQIIASFIFSWDFMFLATNMLYVIYFLLLLVIIYKIYKRVYWGWFALFIYLGFAAFGYFVMVVMSIGSVLFDPFGLLTFIVGIPFLFLIYCICWYIAKKRTENS